MKFPVFDLHCDTAFAMLGHIPDERQSLYKNNLQIDLCRAGELPGYAQCFACFTSSHDALPMSVSPQELFAQELAVITEEIQNNNHLIAQAFSANDIEQHLNNRKMSAVLSIEGPAGFDYDPKRLEQLYKRGFRITTLGWNEKGPLTGSHISGGGLTELGKQYVQTAQSLGMLIDVSHISDEGFLDIMELSTAPVIASHSNSRSIWNVSRNLTDEMFFALCKTGGVTGINLYSCFLGDDPNLDTVCDHIIHFLNLDPDGKHIALGGDLDGCDELPKGFTGINDYAKLADCMLKRGITETTVYDIFWNNALGVMKHCCM